MSHYYHHNYRLWLKDFCLHSVEFWNNIPLGIKSSISYQTFKCTLKLASSVYPTACGPIPSSNCRHLRISSNDVVLYVFFETQCRLFLLLHRVWKERSH